MTEFLKYKETTGNAPAGLHSARREINKHILSSGNKRGKKRKM